LADAREAARPPDRSRDQRSLRVPPGRRPARRRRGPQAGGGAGGRGRPVAPGGAAARPAPAPLDKQGDLAAEIVAGIDRFLLREIDASVEKRAALWKRDKSTEQAYEKSAPPQRR